MAAADVDAFLSNLEEPNRAELSRFRSLIMDIVPEAAELISDGIPSFKYKGKYLVGYNAFKKHLSLFPGGAPMELMADKLVGYKVSAGTVQFTLEKPLSDELIRKLVLVICQGTIGLSCRLGAGSQAIPLQHSDIRSKTPLSPPTS